MITQLSKGNKKMNEGKIPNMAGGVPPYNAYYDRPRRKSQWWIPLLIIGVILVLILGFFITIFGFIGAAFEKEQIVVRENSVLYLSLNNVQEYYADNPFELFSQSGGRANYFDLIHSIKRAKNDDNIKGIFYVVKMETGLSPAKAAELQSVLEDFKTSGKFIYSFIQVGAERNYYNALPSHKIFMPDEGLLEMNGFAINGLFFKDALSNLGMEFHVMQYEDYKSAGESFSRNKYSDSARHQLQVVLQSRYDDFINSIVKYRKLDEKQVRAAISNGIYSADSLKHYGFIDDIMTEDNVKLMLKEEVFGRLDDADKLNFININRYANSRDNTPKTDLADCNQQIAIIYAVGGITHAKSDGGWSNEVSVRSEEFISFLRKAREDDDVKAIIIRIDSPGGSVIASDDIYNEIIKTRAIKPVFASLSDVAASGGYYIAMACDTIIAHQESITGSIGVITMINNLSGTLNKLSISTDTITTGPAANFLSPFEKMKESDKKQLNNISESIYRRFVLKAAESRSKSYDEMRIFAKGRIWLGSDAKKHNLIDVQGGFLTALDLAKERIGVPTDKKVIIKTFPSKEESLKSLLRLFGLEQDDEPSVNVRSLAKSLGVSPTDFIGYWGLLPAEMRQQIIYTYQLVEMSNQENTLLAIPYYYELK